MGMGRQICYFIKFHKQTHPTRLVCDSWQELWYTIDKLVIQYGEPFEWIIRD